MNAFIFFKKNGKDLTLNKANKIYRVEWNFQAVSVEKCDITKQENFVSGRFAIKQALVVLCS
jgi:hypothetical protein